MPDSQQFLERHWLGLVVVFQLRCMRHGLHQVVPEVVRAVVPAMVREVIGK